MQYMSPVAQTLYEYDFPMDSYLDHVYDTWYGYYVLTNPALGSAAIVTRTSDDIVEATVYRSFRESEAAWSKLF